MLDPAVETRSWDEQTALDGASYPDQLVYLVERSPFYRAKLAAPGSIPPARAAALPTSRSLPLTEKDELRASRTDEKPFGAQLCVEQAELVRIYSTSGTTGAPSYIPLTAGDLENWVTGSARSYAAAGIGPGDRVLTTYNAGPFVAGAALDAFQRIGVTHVPVGTGTSDRLLRAIDALQPTAIVLTPSYAAYLLELADLQRLERATASWSPASRVAASLSFARGSKRGGARPSPRRWGSATSGRRSGASASSRTGCTSVRAGFVHAELIDPATGVARAFDDGAEGELVLTHLRHRAAPLLRFRTRDHVVVADSAVRVRPNGPRIRCLGRTDDMLIVRGVNVFPSAVREVVGEFAPAVSGNVLVRPRAAGVKQEPPLPVSVELARDVAPDDALVGSIRERLRGVLTVQTEVELVPFGALQRSEYKSKLIER